MSISLHSGVEIRIFQNLCQLPAEQNAVPTELRESCNAGCEGLIGAI
jgi:hypothetical protein